MAGRKTCARFERVAPACLSAFMLGLKPHYFQTDIRRFLRSVARNVGKGNILPRKEVAVDHTSENEKKAKLFEKPKKIQQQFMPFKIKIPEIVNAENQYDCLAQVVTPLYKMPYEEQLELKHIWAKHILTTLLNNLVKEGCRKLFHLDNILTKVVPSPVTNKYRNKDELSVHLGVDGNPKTVGFYIGTPSKGIMNCVRCDELINVKDSHKKLAQVFEQYISSSPLKACHHFQDGGHWRNFIVRSNLAGDLMGIVIIHPQMLSVDNLNQEAESIARFFTEGDGKECNLASLYFQACPHTRCSHDQAPFKLLSGKPFLTEVCLDRQFRISPDSFFQVNTLAAELLYETILRLAGLSSMTTLLDVCCGTGTLATLASPAVRGVVGIESVYSAVRDARANAIANGCSNVEIIPGLAEKKLPKVIDELEFASDLVAVINPGRAGVGERVIKAIRECRQIERVVYVSCNASGPAMKNFVQLCAPSEGSGKKWPKGGIPFNLTRAVPIDLFPHAVHCELVLQFQRRC